ncbi:hypothetical protein OnM2_033112, partial [Erysiphe neolycopersici]
MEVQDTPMDERWVSEVPLDQTPIGNGTNPSLYEPSLPDIKISRSSSPDILLSGTSTEPKQNKIADSSYNNSYHKKRPGSTSLEESDSQRPIFDFIPNKADAGKKIFNAHYKPETVKGCVELAFNMVLRAMYLSEDMNEKQNIHDISIVHREYQESGKIGWARSILGQEIRALERISRNLGSQVQKMNIPKHSQQQQQQQQKQTAQMPDVTRAKSQNKSPTGNDTKVEAAVSFAKAAAANIQLTHNT